MICSKMLTVDLKLYFGAYPFKHLVGIVKVFQQKSNLRLICCPGQELPKLPLDSLHCC